MTSETPLHFTIRRQIIEFAALPASKWLPAEDGSAAVQTLLQQLLDVAVPDSIQRHLVDVSSLTRFLDASEQQIQSLVDVLEAVRPSHPGAPGVVRRGQDGLAPEAVDAHALALFLFAQSYMRQTQLQSTMDVWPASPGESVGGPGEPASPARRVPHTNSAHFQHQRSNQVVRKELQQHLQQHRQLMHGYTDHLQRHAAAMLALCLNPRRRDAAGQPTLVSAAEVDRLSLLLAAPSGEDAARHGDGDGSPMEISPTPFSELGPLSQHMPVFEDGASGSQVPLQQAAEWLAGHIRDDSTLPESMVSSPTNHGPAKNKWDNLPPAGQYLQGGDVDVQGVVKSTVARGEDEFPSGLLRVSDCHDSVVYALAPLQFASIYCCSDCTVVLGAVGRLVRIERCERVQLIAAAARLIVSSCHDCIFYLGINRAPLLIGDNRFIQMAPYNTQYERLGAHMEAAGVAPEPNLWDQPVSLTREHGRATPDTPLHSTLSAGSPPASLPGSPNSGGAGSSRGSGAPPAWSLLPPEKLLPFMIPFQGGRGHMCGGAATDATTRWSADVGSLVGLESSGSGGSLSQSSAQATAPAVASGGSPALPNPLRLPQRYEEAKEHKVQSVANLRTAVKSAVLDDNKKRELQSVIQSHFKEWLLSSGNMRQVYDLARMEREPPQH